MIAPRRPFGTELPGRLPSTVMKVLAAEISDPERLRRGKAYAREGAVLDIDVTPGMVTCEVQGSRSTPYVVTLQVAPGDGLPMARDLLARCSCPDESWDSVCKHVVTTMFTLADEFLIEPQLMDLWRGNPRAREHTVDDSDRDDADRDGAEHVDRGRRHLRVVRPDDRPPDRPSEPEPVVDPLEAQLRTPAGTTIPTPDDLAVLDATTPPIPGARTRSPRLDDLLDEARARLRLDWD